jgi:hypothetical protein
MTKSLFLIRACIGLISTTHQNIATAFITPSHKVRTQYGFSPPLKAIVYYPDDYVNEDPAASMDQAAYNINSDIFNESPLSQLADRLFSNQDNASVLARLASAYSPPGYSIDLSNISNVRCLCVDTKHLEIEAVVCDNYECSSLLVPVDFPKECNLDYGLEECVLNNIQNLEKQGDDLIQDRMHSFADEEEAQKAYEVFKLVGASDYLKPSPAKFPEWWVPPTSSEDVSECNMIEKLLNEADWQLEMRELCKHALQESGDAGFSYEDEVQLALVKAIGPSGMVLEAHVSRGGKSVYDYGGMNNIVILYVPIKFPLESTSGNASIRDHVLGIVSSVNA